MKTKATVISVQGTLATVEVERISACDGCHKIADGEKGCAVCSLMGGNTKKITSTADNSIGANVGDSVFVESPTSKMLLYAALVFLFPLVVCFASFLIASLFTELFLWKLTSAAVGFLGSFLVLFIYSVRIQKKRPDAVITEIIFSTPTVVEKID